MTAEELDVKINAIVTKAGVYGLAGLSEQIWNLVSDAIASERERCARVAEVRCGCKVTDYHGHCIDFCPLHGAAAEMLELLKELWGGSATDTACNCTDCKAAKLVAKLTSQEEKR